MRTFLLRLNRRAAGFARAREGLAALEFALILPMMVVLLLTSIELINILQTNTRVENTAASLSDVISRDTELTDQELEGLWTAVEPLMFPATQAGVALRITSISIDEDINATAIWSEQCRVQANGACGGGGFTDIADDSPVPASQLPDEMVANSSLIRVEIAYPYDPMVGFFYVDDNRDLTVDSASVNLRHTSFRRSRLVDPITRVEG